MIGWVVVRVWAAASRRPVPLARPTHPLRGGAGCGFKIQNPPLAGPYSERAGVAWVLALAGRAGVRDGEVGGALSPRPGTGGNQEPAGRSSGGRSSLVRSSFPPLDLPAEP